MRAGGFPGNPGGLVVSILKTAGARAPAHQARGRGRRTWRPTERTAGARMVPPGEGNEARGDGRRGVGVSHSTAEAGELSPRDPVEGRGHRQVAPLEGKTANTPRLGPVSTSRQRIAELARQAVGMAVAIAWLPGPAGTRRRVAKLSVEEPDAAEPARPDLWGARVSNDPGLPDRSAVLRPPAPSPTISASAFTYASMTGAFCALRPPVSADGLVGVPPAAVGRMGPHVEIRVPKHAPDTRPGISVLPAQDGIFIHPRAAERQKFCSSHNRPAPEAVTSARADVRPRSSRPFPGIRRRGTCCGTETASTARPSPSGLRDSASSRS